MSTGVAAAYQGRSLKTRQQWSRDGIFSPASRTSTGWRADTKDPRDVFLGPQMGRPRRDRPLPEEFVASRDLADTKWVEELGGELNFGRKHFLSLIDVVGGREIRTIVGAHRDRLVRWRICGGMDDILMLNNKSLSPEQEMVQDLKSVVDCLSKPPLWAAPLSQEARRGH
jgi:putative resolvase